jgi:nicotinamide phosphoribosyltransferase
MLRRNLLLKTDTYKSSHAFQYPPGMTYMRSYLEPRGGPYQEGVFFGLQYLLNEYLTRKIERADVLQAKNFFERRSLSFTYDAWMDVATRLNGKLPIRIRAVPEGAITPVHLPLMVVDSTDEKHPWIVNYFEALLERLWYPCTVATLSMHANIMIEKHMKATCDTLDKLPFMLHDFGARGSTSGESAALAGAAHLLSFMGSDTIEGMTLLEDFYHALLPGASIDAMEHSTVTAWGRENEVDAYRNMLRMLGTEGRIVACVSDSYNIYNACRVLWGTELRDEVMKSGATVVIRPDSGDPIAVLTKCMNDLAECFGVTENTKGYKLLKYVRMIWGDGITPLDIDNILYRMSVRQWSADNFAFGMGGGLHQKDITRDTMKWAYKCCEILRNGEMIPVYKDPIDDAGKKSYSGEVDLSVSRTHKGSSGTYAWKVGQESSVLVPYFQDGEVLRDDSYESIKQRMGKGGEWWQELFETKLRVS